MRQEAQKKVAPRMCRLSLENLAAERFRLGQVARLMIARRGRKQVGYRRHRGTAKTAWSVDCISFRISYL